MDHLDRQPHLIWHHTSGHKKGSLSQNSMKSYPNTPNNGLCLLLKNIPFPTFLCTVMDSDVSQVISPGPGTM